MSVKDSIQNKETSSSKTQSVSAPVEAVSPEMQFGLGEAVQRSLGDSRQMRPRDVVQLQRTVGNAATLRRLGIQPKLTVGAAGDQYEQEADQTAARVLSMAEPAAQRKVRSVAGGLTPVQRESADPRGSFDAGAQVESKLAASKGGGSPLPGEVRSYMEPRFGADFSGVRVHEGSEAAQLNRQLSAQAFTHGQDIYMGEGKSVNDKGLLAHELTHTIQQTGGVQRDVIQRWGKDNPEEDPDFKHLTPDDYHFAIKILGDFPLEHSQKEIDIATKVKQIWESQSAPAAPLGMEEPRSEDDVSADPHWFEKGADRWRTEHQDPSQRVPKALEPMLSEGFFEDDSSSAPQADREDEGGALLGGRGDRRAYEEEAAEREEKVRGMGKKEVEKASKPKRLAAFWGMFSRNKRKELKDSEDEASVSKNPFVKAAALAQQGKEKVTGFANGKIGAAASAIHGGFQELGDSYSRENWQSLEAPLMDHQMANWEKAGLDPDMRAEFLRRQYPNMSLYYQRALQADLGGGEEGKRLGPGSRDYVGSGTDAAMQAQSVSYTGTAFGAAAEGVDKLGAQNEGVAQGFGAFTSAIAVPGDVVDLGTTQLELQDVQDQIRAMTSEIEAGDVGKTAHDDAYYSELGNLKRRERKLKKDMKKAGTSLAGNAVGTAGGLASAISLACQKDPTGITGAAGTALGAVKMYQESRELAHERKDLKFAGKAAAAMDDGSAMAAVTKGALGRQGGKWKQRVGGQALGGANLAIGAAGAAIGIATLAGASVASMGIVPIVLAAGTAAVGVGVYVGKLIRAKQRGLTHERLHVELQTLLDQNDPNFVRADEIAQQLLTSDPQVIATVLAHQVADSDVEGRKITLDFLRGIGVEDEALNAYADSEEEAEGEGDEGSFRQLYEAILKALKEN